MYDSALNHVAVIPVKPDTPQVDESNLLVWQGLLVPDAVPYNKVAITNFPPLSTWLHFLNESCLLQGAFLIDIVFPAEYPFKPPKVKRDIWHLKVLTLPWQQIFAFLMIDTRQVSFRTKIYHPNIDEKGQVMTSDRIVLQPLSSPTGVSPNHRCRELEAGHQDWASDTVLGLSSQWSRTWTSSESWPCR